MSRASLNNDKFSDTSWLKPSKSAAKLSQGIRGRRQFARAPGLGRNFSQAELELLSAAPSGLPFTSRTLQIRGWTTFDEFKKTSKRIGITRK